MNTSAEGISLIKSFESFQPKPYKCPAGVWTIGYGATYYPATGKPVKPGDPAITEPQATELLQSQLRSYENAVNRYAKGVNQSQFDALVSFAFNVGITALQKSKLLKRINLNPNDVAIAAEFLKWVFAAGKKLLGLVRRRKAESALYFQK